MSIVSAIRPSVTAIDRTRSVFGRFASPSSPMAITEVELPNGLVGYQVGMFGRIFARKADAIAFAAYRAGKAVSR